MNEKQREKYVLDHQEEFYEWCREGCRECDCPDSENDWLMIIEQEMEK